MTKFKGTEDFLLWMRDFYFRAPGDPMAGRINEFLRHTCQWKLRFLHRKTACGKVYILPGSSYKFCPNCGFPIKLADS
jgi:hypothetical protein